LDHRKAIAVCAEQPHRFPGEIEGECFAVAPRTRNTSRLVPLRLLIAALSMALLAGCATTRWNVVKQFRQPGESLQALPDEVWEEYDCASQKRPFLVIERNELSLIKVSPGNDFGHRMVYIMCPVEPTEVVAGELSTRIRFKGSPIVQEMDEGYEIKPGRWVIDAIVHLPQQAEPGVYAYELEFDSKTIEFHKSLTFVVVKR
jgi:hypothetical protein